MNCTEWRAIVVDIARGVGHAEEAGARTHLSECEACRRYLQQQRALTAGLRALAARGGEVPSNALECRFLAAVDARPLATRGQARTNAPRMGQARWLKIAAAVVLASTAIAGWQWHERVAPASRAVRQAEDEQPGASVSGRRSGQGGTDAAQPTTAPRAVPDSAREDRAARSRVFARPAPRPARPRIVQATGFVALPAAAMLPPFERGEIVRVQVGLATLANLGFTVQPDAVDDARINADLLVGQDGQPRAIRLVTEPQASRSRR